MDDFMIQMKLIRKPAPTPWLINRKKTAQEGHCRECSLGKNVLESKMFARADYDILIEASPEALLGDDFSSPGWCGDPVNAAPSQHRRQLTQRRSKPVSSFVSFEPLLSCHQIHCVYLLSKEIHFFCNSDIYHLLSVHLEKDGCEFLTLFYFIFFIERSEVFFKKASRETILLNEAV